MPNVDKASLRQFTFIIFSDSNRVSDTDSSRLQRWLGVNNG